MTIVILALYVILNYFIMGMVLYPAFDDLERQNAIEYIERFTSAMRNEIQHLDTLNNDWAAWDDTYQFIVDSNPGYIKSNLVDSSFFENEVNLIYLINNQGRVVWGKAYDLETEKQLEIKEFPADIFPDHHPLLSIKRTEDFHAGVFISSAGPMFVSARPILTSEMEGPAKGTLIMARLIDGKCLLSLKKQSGSRANIWAEGNGKFNERNQEMIDELNGSEFLVSEAGEDTLNVFSLFEDIKGDNRLLLEISVHRDISVAGKKTSQYVIWSILAVSAFVMAFFLVFLRARILAPIRKLTGLIIDVGKHDDLYVEMDIGGCEEVRILAREFNDMVSKLNLERYKMINQSYFSGMAEVTSDLIHNIRNTLNPIVTDVVLLREKCSYMPLDSMRESVGELMKDGELDPDRKGKLKEFLVQSLNHLEKTRNEVDRKLGNMEKQSDITRKLLDGIEDFSQQGFYVEKFSLNEVMKDVSDFFRNKFPEVAFHRSVDDIRTIKSHKSALIQVIVNLLQNAGEAVALAPVSMGKVELGCKREMINEQEVAHISVKDNGEGIQSENMDRIFQRGFSTKNKKISGIGLHWCANTTKSLGGNLYAESEGESHGAAFHLIIPLEPEF